MKLPFPPFFSSPQKFYQNFNRTFEARARGSQEAIDRRQPASISSSKTAKVQTELIRGHVKHYFAQEPHSLRFYKLRRHARTPLITLSTILLCGQESSTFFSRVFAIDTALN